jgi:hypothetical protein
MAVNVARMGDMRNTYEILVQKTEGERPLWRPRRKWEDNVRMELREAGREVLCLMRLAYDRERWRALVNTVMNLRVP